MVLDVLGGCEARVAEAAALLGISTGNLIDFLQTDPKVWQEANRRMRAALRARSRSAIVGSGSPGVEEKAGV